VRIDDSQAAITLHLVDIDNLTGDPRINDGETHGVVREAYFAAAGFDLGDQIVVGVTGQHDHAQTVRSVWPDAHVLAAHGRDGADLALLGALASASLENVRRVVIGSGDRIFTVAVDHARRHGLAVHVVGRAHSTAASLRLSADTYLPLRGTSWLPAA
jgi:hypothetical protein